MYQGNIKDKTLSLSKLEEKSTQEINKKRKIYFGIILFFIIILIIYIYIRKKKIRIIGKKDGYSFSKKNLIFKKSGEYSMFGNLNNVNIIIKSNYVTLYFTNGKINTKSQTIIIEENILNTTIYLNNILLSNSKNNPIFKIKKNSNLILNDYQA